MVWILFHGFTQQAGYHPFRYTDFPRHTRLLDEPAVKDWRLYFADGGDKAWNGGADRQYVRRLVREVLDKHPDSLVVLSGFSMGGLPVGWAMQDFPDDIHRALNHSALWSTVPSGNIPIMGVINKSEHVPHLPFVRFDGACPASPLLGVLPKRDPLEDLVKLVPNTSDAYDEVHDALAYSRGLGDGKGFGGMQSMFDRAMATLPNFVPSNKTPPHRENVSGHRWDYERNSFFANWLSIGA